MTLAWVIGRGGLIGSAIDRELMSRGTRRFDPPMRFVWDETSIARQIDTAARRFAAWAADEPAWEVYWAAGVGTMSSDAAVFGPEKLALRTLLDVMSDVLAGSSGLVASSGRIALTSSAGAVYAGIVDGVVDENTLPAPTGAYGRAKLAHEQSVHEFVRRTGSAALLARLSTVYGSGQSQGKSQGLLSHLARSIVRRRPIQIFVPLDTIRDYIAVEDAASSIVDALRGTPPALARVKIVASQRPTTIGEIVGVFRRVAPREPRIVMLTNASTASYARRIEFRSIVPPLSASQAATSLHVGIGRLMSAERLHYAAGPGAASVSGRTSG